MRGKVAKKLRKEIKKQADEVVDQLMDAKTDMIPVAGCPSCEKEYWVLELDAYPPDHTMIVSYICANPICNMKVVANHSIEQPDQKVPSEEMLKDRDVGRRVPVEELCQECGFEGSDCQCDGVTYNL